MKLEELYSQITKAEIVIINTGVFKEYIINKNSNIVLCKDSDGVITDVTHNIEEQWNQRSIKNSYNFGQFVYYILHNVTENKSMGKKHLHPWLKLFKKSIYV